MVSSGVGGGTEAANYVLRAVSSYVGEPALKILSFEGEIRKARGFYAHSVASDTTGARLSWGGVNNHILVELPGVACSLLAAEALLNDILARALDRVSRIDLAGDIETDVTPAEFLYSATIHKAASRTSIDSQQGLTEYVGSRTSDRFMRVYRYREPHPRHNLLRIEHEFKGDMTKEVTEFVIHHGAPEAFLMACARYNFRHPVWILNAPGATDCTFTTARERRDKSGVMRWLNTQVAPAIARAQREGLINLDEWIENYIKPLL